MIDTVFLYFVFTNENADIQRDETVTTQVDITSKDSVGM